MAAAVVYKQPIVFDSAIKIGVAKLRITHADLTDADTSQVLTWSTLIEDGSQHPSECAVPANARIMWQWANLLEEFSGGGNTAVVYDVGDAGTDDELTSAISVFTGAGTGIKPMDGVYTLGTFEAAYAPIVTFTTTTGTCAGLTAGVLEVFILYQEILDESLTS